MRDRTLCVCNCGDKHLVCADSVSKHDAPPEPRLFVRRAYAARVTVEVRRATRADMPNVLELLRELASFEKLAPPDGAGYARLIQDLGRRFDAFVAVEDGQTLAYAIVYETYSSFAAKPALWLEDVYVTPSARRKGVGKAMLEEVRREAARRGCVRVAWAVLDWNVEAQKMYDALGATRKPWLWYEIPPAAP